jgi:TfoX/Sxy family transcriptional regulator of competence genes
MQKLNWKKVPPELEVFLGKALVPFAAQKKSMFGCPVYFVNNNLFAGLHQDNLFVRLSEQDRAALLKSNDEASVFEPMPGRQMREYMVLPETLYSDQAEFTKWLKRSHSYVLSLPPKKAKKPKKKK